MNGAQRRVRRIAGSGRQALTRLRGTTPSFDRRAVLLDGVTRGMRILEVGPSYAPLAPKAEGWDVCVVDHASREELAEKYADPQHGVDTSRIEDVDIVWREGRLDEIVPQELHGFDVCLASHVIEHTPDLVGFVRGVMACLAPYGWLSLAIPDMRYCFDFFEAPTRVGEVVEAHLRGASRHSLATLLDHHAYAVRSDGRIAWGQEGIGDTVELVSPFDAVRELVAQADAPSPDYVDSHAWQFTPASFELVVLELAALGLIDAHLAACQGPVDCEFFVTLRRGSDVPRTTKEIDARRLSLLRRSAREVGAIWAAVEPA